MRKLSADIMHFLMTGAEPNLDPLAECISHFTELDINNNPVAIKRYRNLTYFQGEPRDAIRRKLDLYLPNNQQTNPSQSIKPTPIVIFVHGGAWRIGSKDDLYGLYGRIARKFAANKIPFAITNYRLTPRVKHPGHIQDIAAALAFLHQNAQIYNYSPRNIFLMGHSSGGHLVSLLTLDKKYLAHHNLPPEIIKGVIILSGVFNLTNHPDLYTENQSVKTKPPFDQNTVKTALPFNHLRPDAPPFLLIHESIGNEMIRETKHFAEQLNENKIPHDIIKMQNTDHISMLVELIRNDGRDTLDKIISFIQKHNITS